MRADARAERQDVQRARAEEGGIRRRALARGVDTLRAEDESVAAGVN